MTSHRARCSASGVASLRPLTSRCQHRVRCRLRLALPRSRLASTARNHTARGALQWHRESSAPTSRPDTPRAVSASAASSADAVIALASAARHSLCLRGQEHVLSPAARCHLGVTAWTRRDGEDGAAVPRRAARVQGGAVVVQAVRLRTSAPAGGGSWGAAPA